MKFIVYFFLIFSLYANENLTISNGEWLPFMGENLYGGGIVSRIVSQSFEKVDIRVNYLFLPWNRAFTLAEKNQVDGSIIWSVSPERKAIFYISDSIMEFKDYFFYRKDFDFKWSSEKDFRGLKIGVVQGNYYGSFVESLKEYDEVTFEEVHEDEQNFYKLLNGRIDLLICNNKVGRYILETYINKNREEISMDNKALRVISGHLLVSKKNKEGKNIIEEFNKGLHLLKESGEYKTLLDTYK